MRRVEDYFAFESEFQPFARIEKLRGCVFDAAVGSGDVHLCFIVCLRIEGIVGFGEGEEIEVHLRRKAFRQISRGEPTRERDEARRVYCSVMLLYPVGEGDFFGMDGFAAGFAEG